MKPTRDLQTKAILILAFALQTEALLSQRPDTAAIHALWLHAYAIHEDSAARAQQLCFEVLKNAEKANYPKGTGDAYLTLGAIHRNNRNFPQSYGYLRHALHIRRTLGDSNRVAAVFVNLGINYFEENKYDSAIAAVSYAIKIVESLTNPEYDVLGSEYLLLSNILDEYLEPGDALKYARKSLEAYQKTNQPALIGTAAYALANRLLAMGRRDSALLYYDQAHTSFRASAQGLGFLPNVLTNKGIIHTEAGDFDKAEKCFAEAEILLEQQGDQANWIHFYMNKGQLLLAQGNVLEALSLLKKALPEDPSELDFLEQLYLFEDLSDAYAQKQVFDSAHYYQKLAYAVRDSIYNENKRKEFVRFQTERYKRETTQQELIAQQEASRARLFLLISGLLFLLGSIIAFAYYQRKKTFRLIQKQQEQLHRQEVDELIQSSELRYLSAGLEGRETERELIARELHDQLGSSIVTLSWQYDAILENTAQDSDNYESLLTLNSSLKRLYHDVRQLAHQLGSGVLERVGLIPILNELCETIESAGRMEVGFSHYGMEHRLGFSYEINILRIIQELISNVLKYAKANQLMIQINRIDDTLNIMVEDNGIGFDQKEALQRSGAGLKNIEARLRNLGGTIQFENRPQGGTTVIINIPIAQSELFYE
ncbi:MAG: ATP-binding protein [Saprospiraceae bacterium]